jgi:hypothetical protein
MRLAVSYVHNAVLGTLCDPAGRHETSSSGAGPEPNSLEPLAGRAAVPL